MYIILVYDIMSDKKGARIWRNTFKECKKYLHHIQNSVFEGEITKAKLEILKAELQKHIREDKDSLIIFIQSSNKWMKKERIGIQEDRTDNML